MDDPIGVINAVINASLLNKYIDSVESKKLTRKQVQEIVECYEEQDLKDERLRIRRTADQAGYRMYGLYNQSMRQFLLVLKEKPDFKKKVQKFCVESLLL